MILPAYQTSGFTQNQPPRRGERQEAWNNAKKGLANSQKNWRLGFLAVKNHHFA